MFLSWYSPESIAAAMPSGILYFTILSIFLGTAGYVTTFVAQYHGAGQNERIGPALWQGLYVALIGAGVVLLLVPVAGPLFRFIGHPEEVARLESIYFRILCYGAFAPVASSSLSGFFSGRGNSRPVMIIQLLATGVNIILNYLLIFGNFGFPELGIAGAAIATISSGGFAFLIFLMLILSRRHDRIYHTRRTWRLDRELFGRLMRFGFPNGVQFFIDIFGFTAFILLIGRLGTVALAATNIAFNISFLAFMPMLGLGMGISIMVGQYIGKERVDLAQRSVTSGMVLSFAYMGSIALIYILIPGVFVSIFSSKSDPALFGRIREMAVTLLRFVALYSLFDTLNIVYASAIKGAGDTRYVMIMILIMSWCVLVIPSYLALVVFSLGVYTAWVFITAYVVILGFGFLFRYRGGKWKNMRVI